MNICPMYFRETVVYVTELLTRNVIGPVISDFTITLEINKTQIR